jgi:hypothetical protein
LDRRSNKTSSTITSQLNLDDDDDVVEVVQTVSTSTRGRKTQAAPARGGRGRGGGRGSRGNKSTTLSSNGKKVRLCKLIYAEKINVVTHTIKTFQTTNSKAIAANEKTNQSKMSRFLYNDSDTE